MPETTKAKQTRGGQGAGAAGKAGAEILESLAGGFRFPARIGGVSMALKGEDGETKAKRVFKITLEADEDKLVQGSIPIGRNGVEFAAGEFARLAGRELWVDLVTRQVQLPFGDGTAAGSVKITAPRPARAKRKTKAKAKGYRPRVQDQEVLVP